MGQSEIIKKYFANNFLKGNRQTEKLTKPHHVGKNAVNNSFSTIVI
jgi:hypothetical protein